VSAENDNLNRLLDKPGHNEYRNSSDCNALAGVSYKKSCDVSGQSAQKIEAVFYRRYCLFTNHFQGDWQKVHSFDVAIVSIGAYKPVNVMNPVHTNPEEAIHAVLGQKREVYDCNLVVYEQKVTMIIGKID